MTYRILTHKLFGLHINKIHSKFLKYSVNGNNWGMDGQMAAKGLT